MRKLNITSPYRGENYTAADAVNKLFERRNFEVISLDVKRWESPYMNDFDGYISLEVQTLPSLWGDSIEAYIITQIPFHRTNDGAYSFGCYKSQYTNSIIPEYYHEKKCTIITAWLETDETRAEDEVWFNWDPDTDDPDQKEVQNLLITAVKEALVASVLETQCQDEMNVFFNSLAEPPRFGGE